MHPLTYTMVFALTLGGLLCSAAEQSRPPVLGLTPHSFIEATVTRVIDGNSLDAHVHGRRTAVGYLGVWTPAVTEPCGPEALARNRELAGTRVLLEADPTYEFGELGKRLYYAYTPDGRWIDETLVREGLGRAVRTDARHGAYLAIVQAAAETVGFGCLWEGPTNSRAGRRHAMKPLAYFLRYLAV
jgi:endonuclease YncB( thermonuclease family)